MKKIHFFLLNALLFVLSAQMVVYHVGAIVLGGFVWLVTVVMVPEIIPAERETMKILAPMIVAVFGTTLGLCINFYRNWYLMDNYCYCLLVAIVSYVAGVLCVVFWKNVLGPFVRMLLYRAAF